MKKWLKHDLFWVSIIIVALIFVLIFTRSVDNGTETETRLVCVPSSCCHSDSCVPEGQKPNCEGILCTQDCVPGTLDCGQGSCQAINGECKAVFN